jgi:hypothetical protein
MHVFADLQAYICTSSSCPEMLKTFPSRKSWFEHETTYHMTLRQLNCQLCAAVCHDEKSFLDHAVSVHDILFNSAGTKAALLSTATVSVLAPVESLKCPLCSETGFSRHRQYATHLGKHLESISLASLPQDALSDEEDASSSSEAAMTEQSSTHLTRRSHWLPEEDIALAQLERFISSSRPINWVPVAQNMQYLNPGLNREPITVEEEEEELKQLEDQMGKRWTEIARKLGNRSETTKQSRPETSPIDNFSNQKEGPSAELSQTSSLELSGMPTGQDNLELSSQDKLRDVFPDLQPEYHEQSKEVETIQANRRNLVADRLQAAQQDRLPSNMLSSNRREKSPFKQNSPFNPSRPEKVLQTPALQKSSTLISPRELMLDEGDLNEVNTPSSSKLMTPSDWMLSDEVITVPEVSLFGEITKRADQDEVDSGLAGPETRHSQSHNGSNGHMHSHTNSWNDLGQAAPPNHHPHGRHLEQSEAILREALQRDSQLYDTPHRSWGSKNDWTRHEGKQHEQQECWRCGEANSNASGESIPATSHDACKRVFYTKELYSKHLRQAHKFHDNDVIDKMCSKQRIGQKAQVQFWCGFCRQVVPLKQIGLSGISERYNHIDYHFSKERRTIEQWEPLNGRPYEGESALVAQTSPPESCSSGGSEEEAGEGASGDAHAIQSTALQQGSRKRPSSAMVSGNQGPPPKRAHRVRTEMAVCCQCRNVFQRWNGVCIPCNHRLCRNCAGEVVEQTDPDQM